MSSTIQERWDATFQKLDRACPARRADEASVDYLRRLSRVGRRYVSRDEPITRVRFDDTLPDAVVEKFSEQMREALERAIVRVDNMAPGELRPVIHTDDGGTRTKVWIGPTSFVRDAQYGARACRRVAR